MAYSEPTAQFPTALVTAADLLKPENDATSTTLLQNISSGSPAAGGKLYVNDNANFSTNGGVALIDSTTELIGYSATGSDGTGDYLTVDQRAYPGGSAASAASSGDTVKDVVSAEHFKRAHVELIATQTYLGTNASQTAPIADSVLSGIGAGISSWDTTPTVAGLTLNGASGNTLVVDTTTLVVDATNGRVGVGTASPGYTLEIGSGQIAAPNGSSGAPSYSFANDSDTGMFREGGNRLTLVTGGSKRFSIDATGNVDLGGIGSARTVMVKPSSSYVNYLEIDGSASTVGKVYIMSRGGDADVNLQFGAAGAGSYVFGSGTVGINEISPGGQLHVVSNAASTHIAVFEAAPTPSANLIEVNSNGATGGDIFVIDKSSNAGLGATTFDATAAGVLAIANGTAPAGGTAGQAYIYAKDVAASSEMHVMNEAGFETQISPHDSETGEWVFYSKNTRTGKVLRVQMERLVKFLNSEFGTDFVQEFVEAV